MARTGPTIAEMFAHTDSTEVALTSCRSSTSSTTTAREHGLKKHPPNWISSTTTSRPEYVSAEVAAKSVVVMCATARTTSVPIMTLNRGSTSLTAPPTSPKNR